MAKKKVTVWSPQPGPQEAAVRAAFVDELFYGGAAGGGKSDFLLGDFASDIGQGSAWQGILFRQSYPALDDLVERSHEIYPQLGGKWLQGRYDWRFPGGALLRLRHFETIFDFVKYQGFGVGWIGWDELPEWADDGPYKRMISRLRGTAKNKRIRATGNPGGVGHGWVQERFQIPDHFTTYTESRPFTDPDTGMTRLFIPSRVQDNKILLADDPNYPDRLKGVGDDELVKAWLDGDWSAIVGAYFGRNWNKVELIDSFEIPAQWPVFCGLDYGEASPTAAIWGAKDYDGNLILFDEYYEIRDSASQHAEGIVERAKACPWTQSRSRNIADPNFFVRRRVNEAAVNSAADAFQEKGMRLEPGNNNRINGWRVVNDVMSKGQIKVFKEWCPNFIRTMPKLPRDAKRPEDIDTEAEDHIGDAVRYMMVHIYGARRRAALQAPAEGDRIIKSLMKDERRGRYG